MMNLAELLVDKDHEVTQIAIRSPKQAHVGDLEGGAPGCAMRRLTVPVDTRTSAVGGLWNLLFSSHPYHVTRHRDIVMSRFIQEHLRDVTYDVIQFESIFLLQYQEVVRSAAPRTPVVLRTQNVEHRIWHGLATNSSGLKGWYLRLQAQRMERYERDRCSELRHIMAVTSTDAEWFSQAARSAHVRPIPIGLPRMEQACTNTTSRSFFHLAAMDWLPNREGVRWFMKHVWPMVRKARPDAELHLAGTGMPNDLKALNCSSVHVHDRITDPVPFMACHGVMIVPLLSGSGIRVKILEGMRLGKTIISSPQGASGIDCRDGHDILLARTAKEFVDQMTRCLEDPGCVERIGRNARDLIERRYSVAKISSDLEAYYQRVLDPNMTNGTPE